MKQKHDFHFFPIQLIIKQLLDSVFVISRIIKVLVRVISLSFWLPLITPTLTLIILDITKTASNKLLFTTQSVSGLKRSSAITQNKFFNLFHFFVASALSYYPVVFCFVVYSAMPLLLHFFFSERTCFKKQEQQYIHYCRLQCISLYTVLNKAVTRVMHRTICSFEHKPTLIQE